MNELDVAPPPDLSLLAAGPVSELEPAVPSRSVATFAGRFSLVGLWILLIVVYGISEPDDFLQKGTFQSIFSSQVELVFLSLALICVFVVGEFDLSVASMMGLSATLVGLLAVNHHMNTILASLLAVLASGGIGVINGFLVVVIGVDAIVATLGMGTFLLGLTLALTNLQAVQGLSESYSQLALRDVLGLPIDFLYGLIAASLLAYVLVSTPLGLRMSFVGSSREVARLAGINVNRIRFGAYVASGLLCGLAGIIVAATLGGFDPNTSPNYLLPAFAAVFLGTAAVRPGKFNPIGTLIGLYFLQTGIIGLQLFGLTGWISQVFYGGTLVLAVAFTTVIQRRAAR
jgi:ribose transport system permease protein